MTGAYDETTKWMRGYGTRLVWNSAEEREAKKHRGVSSCKRGIEALAGKDETREALEVAGPQEASKRRSGVRARRGTNR